MQVLSSGVQTRWKAVFRLNESREQTAGAIKLRKCGAYASGLKVRCEVRSFEARGSRLGKVKKGVPLRQLLEKFEQSSTKHHEEVGRHRFAKNGAGG